MWMKQVVDTKLTTKPLIIFLYGRFKTVCEKGSTTEWLLQTVEQFSDDIRMIFELTKVTFIKENLLRNHDIVLDLYLWREWN